MKKHEVLYDIVFPLWSLLIMPSAWIFVIPINFIIDSVVLFFAMAFLEIQEKKKFYLHSVWKVFLFGFLADLIGVLVLLLLSFSQIFQINFDGLYDDFRSIIFALIVSAVFIYIFNYYVSFKKCDSDKRFKLSLIITVTTAPYMFLFSGGVVSSWRHWSLRAFIYYLIIFISFVLIFFTILLLCKKIKRKWFKISVLTISMAALFFASDFFVGRGEIYFNEISSLSRGEIRSYVFEEDRDPILKSFEIPDFKYVEIEAIYYERDELSARGKACVSVHNLLRDEFLEELKENFYSDTLPKGRVFGEYNGSFSEYWSNMELKGVYRYKNSEGLEIYEYEHPNNKVVFIFSAYTNFKDSQQSFNNDYFNEEYEKLFYSSSYRRNFVE